MQDILFAPAPLFPFLSYLRWNQRLERRLSHALEIWPRCLVERRGSEGLQNVVVIHASGNFSDPSLRNGRCIMPELAID